MCKCPNHCPELEQLSAWSVEAMLRAKNSDSPRAYARWEALDRQIIEHIEDCKERRTA